MPITIQPKQPMLTINYNTELNQMFQQLDKQKKEAIQAMYDSGELIAYSDTIWAYMAQHSLNVKISTYSKRQSENIHHIQKVTDLSWKTVQMIKGSCQDKFNGMVQIFNDYAEEKGYKLITKDFR